MTIATTRILCEGYYDRAFWAGWLERSGWRDLGAHGRPRVEIQNEWQKLTNGALGPGEHGFVSASDPARAVVVTPCSGDTAIYTRATSLIAERRDPATRLVLCFDADVSAKITDPTSSRRQSFEGKMVDLGLTPAGDGAYQSSSLRVSLIVWHCDDPPETPGVPDQQSLERLVCAAMAAADPLRAETVERFLTEPPSAAGKLHKAAAFSFMAKWYAEHGCEEFFRAMWRDPSIVASLETRLKASGQWGIADSLSRE